MDKKYILGTGIGLVILTGLIYSSPRFINKIDQEDLLATVKKVATKVLNVYTIPAMSYLKIDAPVFGLLPLDKALFNVRSIIKSISSPIANVTKDTSGSVVNIFCSQRIGNLRKVITGSGVIINSDGTTLTNAHVAEYPLVADSNKAVLCLGRSGSPAQDSYSVKVVFINPEWVLSNGKNISTGNVPETGQSDFALLKLTKINNSNSDPKIADLSESTVSLGYPIQAVAYPADVLGVKGVNASLYLQKDNLTVSKEYMLDNSTPTGPQADIIETTDSTLGQRGSSGGALVDNQNGLVGLITMTTNGDAPNKFHIRGLSMKYIDKELSKYHQGSLMDIVQSGSASLESEFNSNYRSSLTSLLTNSLSL